MCHLVLLLPVIGLVVFWILPLPMAIVVYATILIVTALLYRAALLAMRCPVRTGSEGLIGETGRMIDISGGGKSALVHGEIWRVENPKPLNVGELVRVLAIHGLSLSVEPIRSDKSTGSTLHHERRNPGLYTSP
jgi:membrane protein implicated in regulation of membrane protease activity